MKTPFVPQHHPSEDLLTAYAAGSVVGAKALIAATHLTYCADCRAKVTALEAVGGEFLDQEPGVETLAAVDPDLAIPVMPAPPPEGGVFEGMPRPLHSVLAGGSARWVNVWFGVRELPIPGFAPAARLLWIPAGRRMPRHDHHGEELTLVLKGSFSDATGKYSAGDLQIGTPGLDHQPHAGFEGPCVCLVVEEGGLKLSGWLGRLVAWRGGQNIRGLAA